MHLFYLLLLCFAFHCEACTRANYVGNDNTVVTGRTMDWAEDIRTNLWIFPRGLERAGESGPQALKWTSKYGSVIGTAYDVGTVDGMNEKGLVANVLYLAESDYGSPTANRPTLSIGAWAQYVLDSFGTVTEAVDALKGDTIQIIAPKLPNGEPAVGHLALSDPSGDSAIFEYVKGKLVIHHGKEYQVMTNSPPYNQQLTLNAYWKQIGGTAMLPGTSRASDRFVRASFYLLNLPLTLKMQDAVAGVSSVMSNASVPFGVSVPGQPNIATTIWKSVSNLKDRVYYFSSTLSPYAFWVPLADVDFNGGVKKLTLTGGEIYSGDAASKFQPAEPFKFLE